MKILLATDGSDNAIEAVKFLGRLQFDEPIELTFLSVSHDPQNSATEVIQPWFPEWLAQQQVAFEKHHQKLERMLAGRCSKVSKLIREGHAARVILDEAEADDSDLIVMGAQGHSVVGRMLLGSVSDSVATHARRSVLVVHPNAENNGESAEQSPSIAVAYDSSPAAREAIDEIKELGLPANTPLTLVSISPIFDYMLGEGLAAVAVENEQAVSESMSRALRELCDELRTQFPQVQGVVEKGRHIGDAMMEVVEREKSELLVIGDAGHTLLHDWILGSTTKYVLRHASCSVWLSRHHRHSQSETAAVNEGET